jgi:hypothetical protein
MAKSSRRDFLRSFGSAPHAAEPTSDARRGADDSQHYDKKHTSDDAPGSFQFSLMTLFVITTVVSVLLALNKVWPKKSFTIAVVTAALGERLYRKRIKATIGQKNYEVAAVILNRLAAVLGGAMLGGLAGLLLSLLLGTLSLAMIGVVAGTILGVLFPRAVLAISSLIP